MQNQQQNENENEESSMDTFLCPSFSTYSSNNINDIAYQITHENDNSLSQNDATENDNNDFEFFAFQNSDDEFESLSDNRRRSVAQETFPIFNRESDGRRYSDAAEISISLRKLLIGDEKQSPDPLSSEEKVENDLNPIPIPTETYCLWKPKPKSPTDSPIVASPIVASPAVAWPIKCKKSNSTGSSTNSFSKRCSSKRWKFMSLLRRSKSDGKESVILGTPSLGLQKGVKDENSKESDNRRVAGKKIPATTKIIPAAGKNIPAAVYGRKKEIRRKSYLPYKQELFGFGVGFNAFGRAFPLHA